MVTNQSILLDENSHSGFFKDIENQHRLLILASILLISDYFCCVEYLSADFCRFLLEKAKNYRFMLRHLSFILRLGISMCLEKFRMLWRIKFPVMVILISTICLGKLSYAEGPALKVSPSQTIVQHQISGLVGQKIRIVLSSSELELRKDITLTTRTIPHTNEFAVGNGRFVTVYSATMDRVAQINTIMKNALSGLWRSDATNFVTDVNHAPLIKISLPKRSEAEVGKPYRLDIVTIPDPDGNQVVIESEQPLPNNITLGKIRKNARGNWATELIWTPNPSEVGHYHLSILAQVPEVSDILRFQSQYDMNIDVTDQDIIASSQVKSLQINQAKLKRTGKEEYVLKVSGHITVKRPALKLSELKASLYNSENGNIIAADIPVDANGKFTYSAVNQVSNDPRYLCLIQAEVGNKISSIRRVVHPRHDFGCSLDTPNYPATSFIEINYNLNADSVATTPTDHEFLGPNPIFSVAKWTSPISGLTISNPGHTITIIDSLGKTHNLSTYVFKRSNINEIPAIWEFYAFVDNKSLDNHDYGQPLHPIQLGFDSQGKLICVALSCESISDFPPATKFDYAKTFGGLAIEGGADPIELTFEFVNSLQTHFNCPMQGEVDNQVPGSLSKLCVIQSGSFLVY